MSQFIENNRGKSEAVKTFPNPAGEPFLMLLTDLSAKVCRIQDGITSSRYELQKADLKQGIYFIELRGPKIYRGKIVIE